MCVEVSFKTFDEYCKKCEFHEYGSISHKHYCYKNTILKSKCIPWKKRIKVNLDKTGEECGWQKKNNSASVKSNLDKQKLISFAEGLKSACSDFQYNENELTKEFIEGFLKGKMISRFQSSNTSNSKPNPDGDTN